jgi:hypothetical protein
MSIIFGVHLLRKLYLVSDTRATFKQNGTVIYTDDLIKVLPVNRRISVVEAGFAEPAAYIIREFSKRIGDGPIDELRELIIRDGKSIISEYVNSTGKYGHVELILAGYGNGVKEIDATVLGEVLSAPLVKTGEGSIMNFNMDQKIMSYLLKAFELNGGSIPPRCLLKTEEIYSEMFTVAINIQGNIIKIEQVPCFGGAIFNPGWDVLKIGVPNDLIFSLDFGKTSTQSTHDIIYSDVELLMSFLNKEIKKNSFPTVGGHLFTCLVTPEGTVFPTGDIATIVGGAVVPLGTIERQTDGSLKYSLSSGESGLYRSVASLNIQGNEEMKL